MLATDEEITKQVSDLNKKLEILDDLQRQNDRNEIAIIKKDNENKELKQKLEVFEAKEKKKDVGFHNVMKVLSKETKENSKRQINTAFGQGD